MNPYLGPRFDPDWYVLQCRDTSIGAEQALDHYLSHGRRNGLKPNKHILPYVSPRDPLAFTQMDLEREVAVLNDAKVFDSRWYARRNGIDENLAVGHYLVEGALQGLDPNPFFSSAAYYKANVDVANAGTNPLWHYLMFGYRQRRSASSPSAEKISAIDERVWRFGLGVARVDKATETNRHR